MDPLASVKTLTLLRYVVMMINIIAIIYHQYLNNVNHDKIVCTKLTILFPASSSLLRNPVTNKKHYRLYVINKIPQIRVLDFQKVKLKVSTSNKLLKEIWGLVLSSGVLC